MERCILRVKTRWGVPFLFTDNSLHAYESGNGSAGKKYGCRPICYRLPTRWKTSVGLYLKSLTALSQKQQGLSSSIYLAE